MTCSLPPRMQAPQPWPHQVLLPPQVLPLPPQQQQPPQLQPQRAATACFKKRAAAAQWRLPLQQPWSPITGGMTYFRLGCIHGEIRYAATVRGSMTHQELLQRINTDPNVCGGRPCIRGHRIWVSLILDYLASGVTEDEILREYPQLSADDIKACIAYGSELARERTIHVA